MNKGLNDADVNTLAEALPLLPNLHTLNLSGNNIGNAGATALRGPEGNLLKLRTLNLSDNNIGDDGVKLLAMSLRQSTIEDLNLSDNKIGDAGAKVLADVVGNFCAAPLRLQELNLSDCTSLVSLPALEARLSVIGLPDSLQPWEESGRKAFLCAA